LKFISVGKIAGKAVCRSVFWVPN